MRLMRRPLVAAILLGIAASAPVGAQQSRPLYKDPRQPVERRVEDLLGRMTLEEKVAQLLTLWEQKAKVQTSDGHFSADMAASAFPNGIGGFARPSDKRGVSAGNNAAGATEGVNRDARDTAEYVNAAQHWAVERTRLGIPILMHEESLHGYVARGATSFPQAIALAGTWDPGLVTRVFSVAAREMRARGAFLALAPVVDVARDPRWGRIEETYGEDPYLVTQTGLAAIRGFQGPTLPLAPDKVLVTLKHFTGHGQPENGTNVGPADLGERTLRTDFFPPFEAAVKTYPVRSVMASYNEIDGIPSHANAWLLNGVLRGEWNYQGAVVSDYYGISRADEPPQADRQCGRRRQARDRIRRRCRNPRSRRFRHPARAGARRAGLAKSRRRGGSAGASAEVRIRPVRQSFSRPCDGSGQDRDSRRHRPRPRSCRQGHRPPQERQTSASAQRRRRSAAWRSSARMRATRRSAATATCRAMSSACSKACERTPRASSRSTMPRACASPRAAAGRATRSSSPRPTVNRHLIAEAVKTARKADIIVMVLGDNEQTSREGWADNPSWRPLLARPGRAAGGSGARHPRARQADRRRPAQRPAAVGQLSRSKKRRRCSKAGTSARKPATASPMYCSAGSTRAPSCR